MFLFIFESIGTSELILIAVVALIIFGPRKLPQMAKTIGKTMAEFRNATNEFKSTWEKEVAFEDESQFGPVANSWSNKAAEENTISRGSSENEAENRLLEPQIVELTPEDFAKNFQNEKMPEVTTENVKSEKPVSGKQDWL